MSVQNALKTLFMSVFALSSKYSVTVQAGLTFEETHTDLFLDKQKQKSHGYCQ